MKLPEDRPLLVWVLIFLHVFLALGAVFSGIFLMVQPDGNLLQMPLNVMQGAPFVDFFIPGLILFIFLGVYPLSIAYGLWKLPAWSWPGLVNPFHRMHWSWAGSISAGLIVLIWLMVELVWVEYSFLHSVYFIWSSLIIMISFLPRVIRYLRR